MIQQIKETCLYVQDLHRTRDFYHGQLGLPVIHLSEGRHVFFRAGTSVLLCFLPEASRAEAVLPPHYAYGKQHMAFSVSPQDYAHWETRLDQAGIPITHRTDWGRGYQSFYFEDPDGHVLEIVPEGLWE
ncbi:MAG: VOC family protein [Bernardetiaceae bacterium]